MTFCGFDKESAEASTAALGPVLHGVGQVIDISTLDGMTIAFDYDQALLDLDRGFETIRKLTKTTEYGTGVAMTPAVLREGVVKSHIVIHGGIAVMLKDKDEKNVALAVHTIAHECAHVEITAAYDKCFPDETLKKLHDTLFDSWRWDVIKACWEEYAACRIASSIGHDPLSGYEETFVLAHSQTDGKIRELVRDFDGGGADPLVSAALGAYGTMMKFACYMMGSMAAAGKTLADCKAAHGALKDHWFAPYFDRLNEACNALYEKFGAWEDKSGFQAISGIVEDMVADNIMKIWHRPDGTYTIFIYPDVLSAAKA
jgi:effector-binding domain-containing protein